MPELTVYDVPAFCAGVTERARERGGRFLIGIDGPGASGKSTLAGELVKHLPTARIVHVDDFYLPSQERDARSGDIGPGFDLKRLRERVLAPASRGEDINYQKYDWDKDQLGDWVSVPAGTPLIVEGVYSTQLAARGLYDHRLFCVADPETRLRRGLERDGAEAEALWTDEWMPAEDRYLVAEQPHRFAEAVLRSDRGEAGTGDVRFWSENE
ncbi:MULTISPECIES: uridine kinase [unclassified Streptomyces]|uniref:uridine kinase family protein n=1 Tax=unclassified Streptomyces TaxID=2593676 RepID=UPI0034407555